MATSPVPWAQAAYGQGGAICATVLLRAEVTTKTRLNLTRSNVRHCGLILREVTLHPKRLRSALPTLALLLPLPDGYGAVRFLLVTGETVGGGGGGVHPVAINARRTW